MPIRSERPSAFARFTNGLNDSCSRSISWSYWESEYSRTANFFCDGPDGLEIALRCDRESGLQHVDAKRGQLVRHAQLFAVVHGAAGTLLAIAEGDPSLDASRDGRIVLFAQHRPQSSIAMVENFQ